MLFLNNADLDGLLAVEDCIGLIEAAYQEAAQGRAAQFPEGGRMDVVSPSPGPEAGRRFTWGAMAGVVPRTGMFALRMKFDIHYNVEQPGGAITQEKYCRQPGTYCGLIMLASTENAEPLAFVNDGIIQHIRVGATAGIAAKYLAPEETEVVGMLGSGGMARTYAAAYCAVRPIKRIHVYSLTPANRERFAREMSEKLAIPVVPVDSPYKAVDGAQIVADCTDSLSPIFEHARWVRAGMHITTFGANRLGEEVFRKAGLVVRHFEGPVAVYAEGGLAEDSARSWKHRNPDAVQFDRMPLLIDVIGGKIKLQREQQPTTCFYNVGGSGIQFAAIGRRILDLAKERGLGREVPTEWFLQDIRD